MREALRGALLSVLFFGGLALFALPAMAQSDSGQSPDGSTTCGGGNCASNGGTVDAGNNSSGTPGAGNPLGGNPLGGDPTGGMGDPAPVQTPDLSGGPSGDQALTPADWAAIEELTGDLCDAIRKGEDGGTIIAAILAIAKKNWVVFVIIKGSLEVAEATCNLAGL